jgi:cytochrome c-type biogenesis protein CcmH
MTVFWILAAAMAALAVAFVLVPLLRARTAGGPTTAEANLDVLRAQRRELDADVAAGTLPAQARDEALAELHARAVEDVQGHDAPVAAPRRPWAVAIATGVLVPALAFGLYAWLGQPRAADPALLAMMKAPVSDAQMVELVDRLAQKVRERPDDAKGWQLLARSSAALGRFQESADAYAHLATLTPNDPTVYADWADSLGMAQGRSLAGKPAELAQAALKLDPNHPKALALAGTAALDAGDFAAALAYWQRLHDSLPPESPDKAQVQQVVAEVRERAAAAGKPLPNGPAPVSVAKAPATAPAPKPASDPGKPASAPGSAVPSVTGSVTVAPEIAARIKGSETLFVFARAENGPRMPLAIVRGSARDLPMKFALDDTQAMTPAMKLSAFPAVRIEARVSSSGNAVAQAGDLIGTSAVVKPGARDLRIVIDKVVP